MTQGRVQTLEEWLADIPAALVAAQPWLLFWRGWIADRHADRQRCLEGAFTAFRRDGDVIGALLAWAGVIFGFLSEGALVGMERWIAFLDDMIAGTLAFPSTGVEARVATAMFAAITLRCPSHPSAAHWAERALELARRHPDPFTKAITAIIWFHYQLQTGDLARVTTVVDEMRSVMRSPGLSPTALVNASMVVAWYEAAAALPSYRDTVARTLELAHTTGALQSLRETGWRSSRHTVLCGGLMGALSDGDLVTAAAWLQELDRDVDHLGLMFRFWRHWLIVWEALIRGDVARAGTYQAEMLRLALEEGRPLDEAVAHMLSALVLHAKGAESEACSHLDRGLEIGRAMRSAYVEFMARLIQAKLCLDCGQEIAGLQALRIAMAVGRERGYVSSHVWIPAIMAGLCARALEAGIEPDYVRSLVQKRRLVPEPPPVDVEGWPWPIEILTLGRFEVRLDGQPVRFARKVQRKPLALLKALIAFGGRGVREELVMDALWPEGEGDAARVALASALHRLRSLLGHEQAILRQDGRLSLDSRLCWVDIWAVDRLLGRAETTPDHAELVRKAARLYQGAFLDERPGEPSQATTTVESLRRRLLRHLVRVARQCEEADPQVAVDCYEEALRVDPCAEDACRSLMTVYHRLDRSADVTATYQRCRAAFDVARGQVPSAATRELFQTLSAR